MMKLLTLLLVVVGSSVALPQGQQQQALGDYDYLYDDLVATPDFQQPVPPAAIVVARPRSRQQATARQPAAAPQPRPPPPSSRTALREDDVSTTTHIPILKDSRRTDPVTGAFIYDYMGADGSSKYEVRFPNGTVIGNYSYINDAGERETRWYSAGERGTEIEGDSVISPAPPTLIDETTGPNYVDLSNYDLYRHLEEPYVHIEGPSDPDERGQLSSPDRVRAPEDRRSSQQPRRPAQSQQQLPTPSRVPLDFGDDARFAPQGGRAAFQEQTFQQQAAIEAAAAAQLQAEVAAARGGQRPSRVSRTRVRVVDPAGQAARPRAQVQFDPRTVDASSPDAVLDSLIRQFQ